MTLTKYNRFSTTILQGDRVKGIWNGIPYTGTVRCHGDAGTGPGAGCGPFKFYVNLDTPIEYNGDVRDLIIVKAHSEYTFNQTISHAN